MTETGQPLGIVTGAVTPELSADGQALAAALRDRGLEVEPVRWRPTRDWDRYGALLLRSCWNYYRDPEAFDAWLETVEAASPTVYNPPEVVRWNRHKFYLDDLRRAGVRVLDTVFVEQGERRELVDVLDERGWAEAVVKPAVGTSSAGVTRVSRDAVSETRSEYESLRADGDVLVQRFAPEIDDGERSLVFFRGAYSHAARSIPPEDEFRSHPNFGGRTVPYEPPAHLVDDARSVLTAAADLLGLDPEVLLYARVDGIERPDGLALMELELIEPHLGLRRSGAVERFAGHVAANVTGDTATGGRG